MKILRIVLIILLSVGLIFCLWKLGAYWLESRESSAVTDALYTQAVATPAAEAAPVTPAPTAEPAEGATPEPTADPGPEWEEYAPFSVDFEVLWEQSEDIVAWLYCEDTPINYPIAQSYDNEYYVERLLDGSWNAAGTLFLDCTNEPDFSEFNNIVYGHNMVNDSMFGTLDEYYDQAYYDEHPTMYLLTPEQYYKVELVAGVVNPIDSWLYNLDFTDPQRKADLLFTWTELSTFETDTQYTTDDTFVTLSTCTYDYDYARFLLVGKLTPIGGALPLLREQTTP